MNKNVVIALLSILAVVSSQNLGSDQEILTKAETTNNILETMMETEKPKELFKVWHYLFNPNYSLNSEEALKKYKVFKGNLKFIKETNAKNLSYSLGLNQFADLTLEEFRARLNKKLMSEEDYRSLASLGGNQEESTNFLSHEKLTLLDLYDDEQDDNGRRNLQVANLTDVNHTPFYKVPRNQGNCGSCWAFSAVATVEGNYNKFINSTNSNSTNSTNSTMLLDYLSPQQLVDCDGKNNGCDGGLGFPAFKYIDANGLAYEKDYKYRESANACNENFSKSPIKTKGVKFCSNYYSSSKTKCNRKKINELLVEGPLAVGIDAGTSDFQFYKRGIFTANCSEDNHAVVLVGFANGSGKSKGFLIVRNSWGVGWGEKGYVRVGLNTENVNSCFVENEGILPLIKIR